MFRYDITNLELQKYGHGSVKKDLELYWRDQQVKEALSRRIL